MAKSVNEVVILGNLGQDPELRSTPTGKKVCTISIATTDSYKDQNGNWIDTTEWHRVTLWDRDAENASQFLKKGSKVYIKGKLKYRKEEKNGVTQYFTDIQVRDMILLDGRSSAPQAGGSSYSSNDSYQGRKENAPVDYSADDDNFDDEVPF